MNLPGLIYNDFIKKKEKEKEIQATSQVHRKCTMRKAKKVNIKCTHLKTLQTKRKTGHSSSISTQTKYAKEIFSAQEWKVPLPQRCDGSVLAKSTTLGTMEQPPKLLLINDAQNSPSNKPIIPLPS